MAMSGEEPDAWFSCPHYQIHGYLHGTLQQLRFTEDNIDYLERLDAALSNECTEQLGKGGF